MEHGSAGREELLMVTGRTWKRNKARQKRDGVELDLMMRGRISTSSKSFFHLLYVYVDEADGGTVMGVGVGGERRLKFPVFT